MSEPQRELQSLGRSIIAAFSELGASTWTPKEGSQVPSKHLLAAEEERFRLWARSLGLYQSGHASLDYRVRDASVIRESLMDLLTELDEHLENLAEIAGGKRLPIELDEEARREMDDASDTESQASASSTGSFTEAQFRLESISSRLDSLFKLATRIRNPRNRPSRPTKDLYKYIPENQRDDYKKNQENLETMFAAHLQGQQLIENVTHEHLRELGMTKDQLLRDYASSSNWLVRRTGIANARRKQQFAYWVKHAEKLARDAGEEPVASAEDDQDEPAERGQALIAPSVKAPTLPISMATSVTKVNLKTVSIEDTKSEISTRSRVSTAVSISGGHFKWPEPPQNLFGSQYFTCPYCGIICPEKYLLRNEWRNHQVHDLQPYHCTYEDCSDANRLYGSKQEWINHENQHRRVWHCYTHDEEFETQPEYLQHLHDHPQGHGPEDSSDEMVAAVVGASANPHRDCPYCPTTFNEVAEMQKHVRHHLERLALFAMPDLAGMEDDDLASDQTSGSHRVAENLGRQDSIVYDFTDEENKGFQELIVEAIVGGFGNALHLGFDASLRSEPRSVETWLEDFGKRLAELSTLDESQNATRLLSVDSEMTQIQNAIELDDATTLSQLLGGPGADVHLRGSGGLLLSLAVKGGHRKCTEELLGRDVDPELQTGQSMTALHWASLQGHEAICRMLLDKGASLDARDASQMTPLLLSVERTSNQAVAKLLLDRGAEVNDEDATGRTSLHLAASKGDEAICRILLHSDASPHALDASQMTPLHFSADLGTNEVVTRLLLDWGAEVDAKNESGSTSLHLAAQRGQEAIAATLLYRGANPDAKNRVGTTPLHMAVREGRFEVSEKLLYAGANVNAEDGDMATPLHLAVRSEKEEILTLLLNMGADVNVRGPGGATPVYWAAQTDNSALTKKLIEAGADIEAANNEGITPLCFAVIFIKTAIVQLLLDAGADVHAQSSFGLTALHQAVIASSLTLLETLLKGGADPNYGDKNKQTALHYAAERGRSNFVKLLVEFGAQIEARDHRQRTPLHLAAKKAEKDTFKELVIRNASWTTEDESGMNALEIAYWRGESSAADFEIQDAVPENWDEYDDEKGKARGDAAEARAQTIVIMCVNRKVFDAVSEMTMASLGPLRGRHLAKIGKDRFRCRIGDQGVLVYLDDHENGDERNSSWHFKTLFPALKAIISLGTASAVTRKVEVGDVVVGPLICFRGKTKYSTGGSFDLQDSQLLPRIRDAIRHGDLKGARVDPLPDEASRSEKDVIQGGSVEHDTEESDARKQAWAKIHYGHIVNFWPDDKSNDVGQFKGRRLDNILCAESNPWIKNRDMDETFTLCIRGIEDYNEGIGANESATPGSGGVRASAAAASCIREVLVRGLLDRHFAGTEA